MLDIDATVLAATFAAFGEVNQGYPIPVYTPAGGSAFDINGIFNIENLQVTLESDGPPVSTRKPLLDLRASDLVVAGVTAAQGDQVTCRGVAYYVRDVRPDGNGAIQLALQEV
jgi:hypothetical protein